MIKLSVRIDGHRRCLEARPGIHCREENNLGLGPLEVCRKRSARGRKQLGGVDANLHAGDRRLHAEGMAHEGSCKRLGCVAADLVTRFCV